MIALLCAPAVAAAQTRNAAFTNPAAARAPSGDGKSNNTPIVLAADPPQVDAGETLVNVARRVTVFFYNGFRSAVDIGELSVNADGNVRAKVVSNDCATLKKLPASDRCSVALEVVPTSPGPWSVELLLNHSGQGRIVRAEVNGSTLGKADEKSEGLAISKKIAAPLDFGEVSAAQDAATRTMLIENDSSEPLGIDDIDLISNPQQGLSLREGGCKAKDTLKPGESCPITIIWQPGNTMILATDLIVHHNGNLGFVVVPIRGHSKLAEGATPATPATAGNGPILNPATSDKTTKTTTASLADSVSQTLKTLPPPTPQEIAQTLPPIRVQKPAPVAVPDTSVVSAPQYVLPIRLIGIVGGRAIIGMDNEAPVVVGLGDTTQVDGQDIELLQLDGTRAVLNISGVRKELRLRNAPSYMQSKNTGLTTGGTGSGSSNGSTNGSSSEGQQPAAPGVPTMSPATSLGAGASTLSTTSGVVGGVTGSSISGPAVQAMPLSAADPKSVQAQVN